MVEHDSAEYKTNELSFGLGALKVRLWVQTKIITVMQHYI